MKPDDAAPQGGGIVGVDQGRSLPRRIVAYADASYCPKTGACGWAVILSGRSRSTSGLPKEEQFSGAAHGLADNNEAETHALQCLATLLLLQADTLAGAQVVVHTDSTTARERFDSSSLYGAGVTGVEIRHHHGHQGAKNASSSAMDTADRLAKREMRILRDAVISCTIQTN